MDSISMDMTEDQMINGSNLRAQKRSKIIMGLKAKFAALGVLDPDLPELDGSKRTLKPLLRKPAKPCESLQLPKQKQNQSRESLCFLLFQSG